MDGNLTLDACSDEDMEKLTRFLTQSEGGNSHPQLDDLRSKSRRYIVILIYVFMSLILK